MIVLYVLFALILLLTLLLFLNVSFVFELKDEFDFKVKILFITLNADKLAGSKKKEHTIQEKTTEIKKKRKKSVSEKLDTIKDIIDLIKAVFGEFLKFAKLKVCYLDVKVATGDAASTALTYGVLSGAFYSAIEFLDNFITVKKSYKKIAIYPDFSGTKTQVNLKIIISIKPIHVLLSAKHLLPILAGKQKGK